MLALVVGAFAAYRLFSGGGQGAGAADPGDSTLVARGRLVYQQHCAICHGRELEGQPAWRTRLPDGRLPAPPHDTSGHTWHHPDAVLFDITKNGMEPHAPPGYSTAMPAFGSTLSDRDIWATLAYIKSTWPKDIQEKHNVISRSASSSR